jgi:hypothetical protein
MFAHRFTPNIQTGSVPRPRSDFSTGLTTPQVLTETASNGIAARKTLAATQLPADSGQGLN